MRSVQREPTRVLGLNRWLQLPPRLWLERPLRPFPPRTSLQVPILITPSLFFFEIERFNLSFDSSVFLIRVASTVDAVLLSHPDTLHLGALPYAMKQLGLSAPVYATEPVHRLGLLTMYDQYLSRKVKSFAALFIFFNYSASCHFLRCANTMIVLFAASLRL